PSWSETFTVGWSESLERNKCARLAMRACPRAPKPWTGRLALCAPSGATKSTGRRRQAKQSRAGRSWRRLSMRSARVTCSWSPNGTAPPVQRWMVRIERIHARAAMIKVLDKPHLDLTTPIGRGFIAFLSALAENERQRIVKRANDGRAAARKRGVHMGRKPKL